MNKTQTREPLFHVVKRGSASRSKGYAAGVRAIAIILGFLFCGIICAVAAKTSMLNVFKNMFEGVFGTNRRIWKGAKDLALLLGVGLALVPAFKMKFYNLGGNGQILISALATTACMWYLGGKIPDGVLNLIMIAAAVAAGALWAVIPAIFKAFFKTNESLFTLMMNYVASGLVSLTITIWVPTGTGTLEPIANGGLPVIGHNYLLSILAVAVITVLMFVYLKYTKHGYELSVVGGSENTARYIGLNVKKVIIRTAVLSGAVCGVIGLLLSGAINHTIDNSIANNMGFTAIMVAWLAQFNPFAMIGTSFLITFMTMGMAQVQMAYNISTAISQVAIAVVYFFIIGCRFFISYKIMVRPGSFVKTRKVFGAISEFFKKIFTPVGEFFKKIFAVTGRFFKKIFGAVAEFFKGLFGKIAGKNKKGGSDKQ